MEKKSSYQKLKEENLELLRDLRLIVMDTEKMDSILTKAKWNAKFRAEDMFLFGSCGDTETQ